MSCLYILDIKPLLVASLADIFAHSTDCFGVFVVASLGIGLHHTARGILTRLKPVHLQWKCRVLPTGSPQNFLAFFVFNSFFGCAKIFKLN